MLLKKYFLLLLLSYIICNEAKTQVTFSQKSTNTGRIGIGFSNAGTIGNPNTIRNDRQSKNWSMQFPKGTGIEHLFEAGIWLGAQVDGQVLVSTSAVDDPSGYSTGKAGYEFTQLSDIKERSKTKSSSNYSSQAISGQDFITNFTDSFVVVPGSSIPINSHTNPLKAVIKLETYAWSESTADYFVIANYEVTNNSDKRWDSIWFGNWSDLVVRNIQYTTDGTGSNYYSRGRNGFDRQKMAVYAYLARADVNDYDYTQSYGAIQFLGMDWRGMFFNPNKPDTFVKLGFPAPQLNINFWNYNGSSPWIAPSTDLDRYNKLKNSIDSLTLFDPSKGPFIGQPANWIQLISAGPISNLNPAQKMNFTMAYVCAKQSNPNIQGTNVLSTEEDRAELNEHLKTCRATYLGEDGDENGVYTLEKDINKNGKLDRYIVPEPPTSPLIKVVTENQKATIYWDRMAEESVDPISRQKDFEGYRLYRSQLGEDLKLRIDLDSSNMIAQWDIEHNDIGFNNGFNAIKLNTPAKFEGDSNTYNYKFEMPNLLNGWQYLFSVTAFDKGDAKLGLSSQESSFNENQVHAFCGTPSNDFTSDNPSKKVGVYPNPYSTTAAWDGVGSRDRKLYFYNLPNRCEITIYTTSGDVLSTMTHDAKNYKGENIRWFDKYAQGTISMSGGEHAWDLLTNNKTQVSTGIYMFSVKDLRSGNITTGNFAILK
jgi:hypothetical protein